MIAWIALALSIVAIVLSVASLSVAAESQRVDVRVDLRPLPGEGVGNLISVSSTDVRSLDPAAVARDIERLLRRHRREGGPR